MAHIQYLDKNTKGRDFVVGDLHGCFSILEDALQSIKFNAKKDRLISVGDLVNRGPESHRVLEFIEQPWFYAVRGNHEEAVIRAIKRLQKTLKQKKKERLTRRLEYSGMGWICKISDKKQADIIKTFKKLPLVIEIETQKKKVGIVHADIPMKWDWPTFIDRISQGKKKAISTALRGRDRIRHAYKSKSLRAKKVKGIDRIFVGHTPQSNNVLCLGNIFCVDTGAALRVTTGDENYHLTLVEITAKKKDILKEYKGDKPYLVIS